MPAAGKRTSTRMHGISSASRVYLCPCDYLSEYLWLADRRQNVEDIFEPCELFEVSRDSVFFLLLCHRNQFGSVESVLVRIKRTQSSMCQFPRLGSKRLQERLLRLLFGNFQALAQKDLK